MTLPCSSYNNHLAATPALSHGPPEYNAFAVFYISRNVCKSIKYWVFSDRPHPPFLISCYFYTPIPFLCPYICIMLFIVGHLKAHSQLPHPPQYFGRSLYAHCTTPKPNTFTVPSDMSFIYSIFQQQQSRTVSNFAILSLLQDPLLYFTTITNIL